MDRISFQNKVREMSEKKPRLFAEMFSMFLYVLPYKILTHSSQIRHPLREER